MSNTPETPVTVNDETVEVKKPRFRKPNLPSKTQLRNGAIIAAASVAGVLLLQNKTGKTVTFETSTADIVDEDSDSTTD